MDISFDKYLSENEENKKFDVVYYLFPERWKKVSIDDSILREENWSEEIKFLDKLDSGISDEIKSISNKVGGIYYFFIKGVVLPSFEKYPAYIGRAKYTDSQNLRKRCMEYYTEYFKKDTRVKISKMIKKWGSYLYLRYLPLEDNELIVNTEASLINGILPPFNDRIPIIKFEVRKPAFEVNKN
ncbi:MAG: hypothetical protein WDZ80_00230 [Candidatus Paceibacterota bacterium]